jgi:ceramide glucosyltransferase
VELFVSLLQWVCLIPTIGGCVYAVVCVPAVLRFCRRSRPSETATARRWPPVTVLKPICGLEKQLASNLRSACRLDYPEYQLVLSVQDAHDPALPILREIEREFGSRVTVVVTNHRVGANGKVNNLLGGLGRARHETLVFSDSDIVLPPDYLRAIVAPLDDPGVGAVCTLFKATRAKRWFERLELLSLNADFIPSVIFAHVTGASNVCGGWSVALTRSTLRGLGGLESLADYLVEDYELGRRVWESGKRVATVARWWRHQVYWDQNTRAARPGAFFLTVLTRAVPFALLFALLRLGDAVGLGVLAAAVGIRLASVGAVLAWGIRDREGLRSLALLPLRDLLGLVSWALAFMKRTVVWRGVELALTRDGRLIRLADHPAEALPGVEASRHTETPVRHLSD